MKRIAIFASGNGTNTENICRFFDKSSEISVVLVCSNKRKAGVLNRIKPYGVPFLVFSKKEMNNRNEMNIRNEMNRNNSNELNNSTYSRNNSNEKEENKLLDNKNYSRFYWDNSFKR